ncbi:hypothetical protein [Nonomuraea basaltis]|uniref:hypothetical protein n=1 Tax=Nonomuraea basaltis TaxID=2495887 RepID=UPI003B84AFA9
MGQALAGAFLKAGHPTTVWNRTTSKAGQLAISTARMLRFSSTDWATFRPPAWVKAARNWVRMSSSISSEASRRTAPTSPGSAFARVSSRHSNARCSPALSQSSDKTF